IEKSDPTIVSVGLVDVFDKPEWQDKKAITMNVILQDERKTLSREEADSVMQKVVTALEKMGGQIR
ncbi:MAG: hypothetical protein WD449_03000, partial [Candidatus Babeliales bacterium]